MVRFSRVWRAVLCMGHPQVRWSLQLMTQNGGIPAQFQGNREGQRSLTTKSDGMWIFPRDPHFVDKAGPILDLYAGRWQGEPLGPKDHILSADEKTSIQARRRCHPSLPPAPGRAAYIENEY